MSPSSTQQWTRRIRYSDQHIRVSDADRNAVAELLGQHYADGRLDQAEFDDLPETGPSGAGPAGPGGPGPVQHRGPRRRGGIMRPENSSKLC